MEKEEASSGHTTLKKVNPKLGGTRSEPGWKGLLAGGGYFPFPLPENTLRRRPKVT